MSLYFNGTRSLEKTDDVYYCLNAWSKEIPAITCKKGDEVDTLILTIFENNSPLELTAKGTVAKHRYKWINEITSFGPPELSKHYDLEVIGKDSEGKEFTFRASLSYDSEDGGRSWSGPHKNSSFLWKPSS